MKEPFLTRFEPWKSDYEERTKEITIYRHYESLLSCDYCSDYDCRGECEEALEAAKEEEAEEEENRYYKEDQPKLKKIPIDKMNLQMLLDMLPEGVEPKDVKFDIHIDESDMGYNGHGMSFYYEKTFPEDMERYKKDLAAYRKDLAEYTEKRKKFEAWKKQQEIEKLKDKLKKLGG